MADQRSKSTRETPAQQRAHSKSLSTIIKQNARSAVFKSGRNTIEKAARSRKR